MVCSKCMQENVDGSTFCRACGSKLEHDKVCTQCGAPLQSGNQFCVRCGAKLSKETIVESPPGVEAASTTATASIVTPKKKKGKAIVGAIVAIIILFCFFPLLNEPVDQSSRTKVPVIADSSSSKEATPTATGSSEGVSQTLVSSISAPSEPVELTWYITGTAQEFVDGTGISLMLLDEDGDELTYGNDYITIVEKDKKIICLTMHKLHEYYYMFGFGNDFSSAFSDYEGKGTPYGFATHLEGRFEKIEGGKIENSDQTYEIYQELGLFNLLEVHFEDYTGKGKYLSYQIVNEQEVVEHFTNELEQAELISEDIFSFSTEYLNCTSLQKQDFINNSIGKRVKWSGTVENVRDNFIAIKLNDQIQAYLSDILPNSNISLMDISRGTVLSFEGILSNANKVSKSDEILEANRIGWQLSNVRIDIPSPTAELYGTWMPPNSSAYMVISESTINEIPYTIDLVENTVDQLRIQCTIQYETGDERFEYLIFPPDPATGQVNMMSYWYNPQQQWFTGGNQFIKYSNDTTMPEWD